MRLENVMPRSRNAAASSRWIPDRNAFMVSKPKIILADEPTGNLDTANGDAVMQLLCEVAKAGTTVVMVTHSLAYAGFAQRTVKLLDGRVVTETLLAA